MNDELENRLSSIEKKIEMLLELFIQPKAKDPMKKPKISEQEDNYLNKIKHQFFYGSRNQNSR